MNCTASKRKATKDQIHCLRKHFLTSNLKQARSKTLLKKKKCPLRTFGENCAASYGWIMTDKTSHGLWSEIFISSQSIEKVYIEYNKCRRYLRPESKVNIYKELPEQQSKGECRGLTKEAERKERNPTRQAGSAKFRSAVCEICCKGASSRALPINSTMVPILEWILRLTTRPVQHESISIQSWYGLLLSNVE